MIKKFFLKKEIQFKNNISSLNFLINIENNFKNKFENTNKSTYLIFVGKDNKTCFNRVFDEEFIKNCTFIDNDNNKNFFSRRVDNFNSRI